MADEGSIAARTVYVENACSLSENHLRSALKKFGEVTQCRVYQSRGFVQFASQQSAETAIARGSVDAYGISLILRRYESHLDPAAGSNRPYNNDSSRGGQSHADDRRPPGRGGRSRTGDQFLHQGRAASDDYSPPTRGDYGRGRRGHGARGNRGRYGDRGRRGGHRGQGDRNNFQVENAHQGSDDDDVMVDTLPYRGAPMATPQVPRPLPDQVPRPSSDQVPRPLPDQVSRPLPDQVPRPLPDQVPRPLPDQVSRPLSNPETMLLPTTVLQPIKILISKISCHSISEDDMKTLLRSAMIEGTFQVLRCTQLEDEVLVHMDIKQTAMKRNDIIFSLLQQGRCTPKISDAFCSNCIKALQDRAMDKRWMVEKCRWSEEEKKERMMRSEMIQHLEACDGECVPLQSFLNRCNCAVSEENINRVCSGVIEVLPSDQTVVFCRPARRLAWAPPDSCVVPMPPNNVQATIPLTNVQATISPTNVQATIPPTNVQATIPPTNVQATIPPTNVQATIPPTNVQATIPPTNVQVTIPPTNVQATIPPTNVQATILQKATIPLAIQPTGMQASAGSMDATVLQLERGAEGICPLPSSRSTETIETDQPVQGAYGAMATPIIGQTTPIIGQNFLPPPFQAQQFLLPSRQTPFNNRGRGCKITPRYHERSKAPLVLADIQVPLTRATYKDKFNKLLFWEESEHMVILRDRCNGCYHLTLDSSNPHTRRRGYITSISGDTIAYAMQASEGATVIIEQGAKLAGAQILILEDVMFRVELVFQNYSDTEEKLSIELPEESVAVLEAYRISYGQISFRVRVEFELKHSYFDGLHKTVDQLSPETIARVLPTTFPPFENHVLPAVLEACLEICSQDQRDALVSILSLPHKSPPLLVRGAFGTGKTFLLAAAVHCLLHISGVVRVLVCTQQHTSALAFLECFHNKFTLTNSASRDNVSIFRLVPESKRDCGHEYSARVLTASQIKTERERIRHSSQLLIVTTCGTSKQLCNVFSDEFFTHILVDEGAQLREPEAMAPLLLSGPQTRIVISGDEHQVGPNLLVLGEDARECGLKFSLLERLHHLYGNYNTVATSYEATLVTNHRSHPDILTLVNTLFYKCNLGSTISPGCAHPLAPFPLIFVCSRVDDATPLVGSSVDECEAHVLLEHARTYASSWPESVWGKIDYSQLCIVSVGRSQLTTVAKVLKTKRFPSAMNSIQRQPTFDIQGRQFRAVFVSTAEPTEVLPDGSVNPSNTTKSICDPFVFNTVMTRAQSLVVCVGNPFLLLRLEQSMVKRYGDRGRCWSHYLRACLDHNTVHCGAVKDEPSLIQRITEAVANKRM